MVFRNPGGNANEPKALETVDLFSDTSSEIFPVAGHLRPAWLLVFLRPGADRFRIGVYSRHGIRAVARHRKESRGYGHCSHLFCLSPAANFVLRDSPDCAARHSYQSWNAHEDQRNTCGESRRSEPVPDGYAPSVYGLCLIGGHLLSAGFHAAVCEPAAGRIPERHQGTRATDVSRPAAGMDGGIRGSHLSQQLFRLQREPVRWNFDLRIQAKDIRIE